MEIVAYWMIVAGILGGLAASVFGWIDWFAIPQETRAKQIGLLHGVGNMLVLTLFTNSWWIRRSAPEEPAMIAHVFSFAGAVRALLTGWLGGELVERLGVGIDAGAHLNAPRSLSNRPISELRDHIVIPWQIALNRLAVSEFSSNGHEKNYDEQRKFRHH